MGEEYIAVEQTKINNKEERFQVLSLKAFFFHETFFTAPFSFSCYQSLEPIMAALTRSASFLPASSGPPSPGARSSAFFENPSTALI